MATPNSVTVHSTTSPSWRRTTPCRRRRNRVGSSPSRPTRSRLQLDQGVRALLIDVWSGIPAGSVVRTAPGSYEEALAVAEAELGPEVVAAAQRIADSVAGEASGVEARFMCHGLCETGSTPFLGMLDQLHGWLAANPDEVITLFIEDHVDSGLIAADIEAAGLLPQVHEPVLGEPWPTLGEMIRSGRRLVVMVEEGDGGDAAPWLVNGFEHTKDTPYTFPTVESFSCDPNRGSEDAPLLLLNHWLSGFSSLVTDAQLVNDREVLLPRAQAVPERTRHDPQLRRRQLRRRRRRLRGCRRAERHGVGGLVS